MNRIYERFGDTLDEIRLARLDAKLDRNTTMLESKFEHLERTIASKFANIERSTAAKFDRQRWAFEAQRAEAETRLLMTVMMGINILVFVSSVLWIVLGK